MIGPSLPAPFDVTKLPGGGTYALTRDTRVDGADLRRFVDGGGKLDLQGYKLFIDAPAPIGPSVLEMTPQGQVTTIFGRILTVPPGTMITGANADGSGCGTVVQLLPEEMVLPKEMTMLSKVTADTITAEQIEVVRKAMLGVPRKNAYHRAILQDCAAALDGSRACRESVALAYNRMNGGTK